MAKREPAFGRIDLHVHSRASRTVGGGRGSVFLPESHSEPRRLHAALRARGMDLVTLLDHNAIEGNLELLAAGLPDVFLSACISASFPEDGCRVQVGVLQLSEAQFAELLHLRENLYELVAYLDEENARAASTPGRSQLAYFLAQPLQSAENRPYGRVGALGVEHLEKALLLFPGFELRSGAQTRPWNELLERLITSLDRATLEQLAERHGIEPRGHEPWRKFAVGGSGDRSGLHLARTWTEFPRAGDRPARAEELIAALHARRTRAEGAHGGPVSDAHTLLKLIHEGQGTESGKRSPIRLRGPLRTMLRLAFEPQRVGLLERASFGVRAAGELLRSRLASQAQRDRRPFERVLFGEVLQLVADRAFRARLATAASEEEKLFQLSSALTQRLLAGTIARATRAISRDPLCAWKQLVELIASHA